MTETTIISSFKNRYPDEEALKKAFSPAHCKYFMSEYQQTNYLRKPCPRLGELGKIYASGELTESLVKEHIRSVYDLSGARYQPDDRLVSITAGRFIGKYGMRCTLYDMMIFFGNFGTDFRTSWTAFDFNDIIKGYKEKYLPWANVKREPPQQRQLERSGSGLTGIDALRQYIYLKVQRLGGGEKGIDAFCVQSGMYQGGMLTRDEIRQRIAEYKQLQNEAF